MDEQRRLRNALGEFATGVVIVTAKDAAGQFVGMTMNSFSAVSLDPPLILFSIGRSAHSLAVFRESANAVVNVLASDQEALSNQFARPLTDKWAGVDFTPGLGGVPLLKGALAHFECEPHAEFDGGDHIIFVMLVLRHATRPGAPDPLVFLRGRYRRVRNDWQMDAEWPLAIHY
jgi:flavin reductase (DIM6/NTAB) family NADH-FMN oxidoreductase RutF